MNVGICISCILVVSFIYSVFNLLNIKRQQTISFVKKSYSFINVVFALIALEIGGSMMLGTCEQAYNTGIYGLLYVFGIIIGFLLLGFGFAAKMKAMNVESTIDLFENRYRSPFIRTCASILSIITIWGLLLGQIIASKSLIHALGITSDLLFILVLLCIVIYAVVGGLHSAGITYRAQLIYTLIVFGGIFGFCLVMEPPSFISNVILSKTSFAQTKLSFSAIFASLVMPALYYITDQEFAKPLFNITNKKTAATSAICASLFMLIFSLIPIYFGIKAKTLNLAIADGVSPLIPVLKILTNDMVVVLAVLGIAGALIAMIDYYLWIVSLSITHEIRLAVKSIPENGWIDKVTVIIVGLIAILASFCTTSNAIQILLYSYELYDCCLIVPIVMSYFQTDLKKGAAFGAIFSGLASFLFFRIFPLPVSEELISFVLSFIGFYIGAWIETLVRRWQTLRRSRTCSV